MKKLFASEIVDQASWNSNVTRLGGCCFHSYGWSLFSAENNDAVPLYFQLNDSSDLVVSLGFGLLKQKRIAGLPFYKTLSFGSLPAGDSKDSLNMMIGEIIAYCRMKKIASLEINSFGTPLEMEILHESGFNLTRRWEFILDLRKSEKDLWEEIHGKKRNLIRKAMKEGVRVINKTDPGALMEFRNLAFKTWKRKKSSGIAFPEPAREDYYRLIKQRLIDTGLGKLYLAYKGEELLAGAFFAVYNGGAYYMLSSSGDEGLKCAAPDLILWTCITDCQKGGYRIFNLGGISEGELNGRPLEESGLYHFKKRFSAEVHPCLKARLVLRTSFSREMNIIKKSGRFFRQFYRIPYCVPAWGWREHSAILKCILSGSVINGKRRLELFEQIRKKTGLKHVLGFNSGQDAIYAALTARGIKRGDKVIMPSYCCETVARAVLHSGADIIFCDIGDDLNPDVDHILSLIDSEVKAVIFPHLFGNPGSIDKLEKGLEATGRRSEILIIDDAAQSFGALLNGKLLGTFGDAGIISFGPGKTMTATGGGLLVTDSDRLSEAVSGLSMRQVSLSEKLKRLFYWVIFRRWRRFTLPLFPLISRFPGAEDRWKGKAAMLCNVDAAIAIEQLKRLEGFIAARVGRKDLLDSIIDKHGVKGLSILQKNSPDGLSVNVATKYLLTLKGEENAGEIMGLYSAATARLRIEIQPLYMPIHLKPEYSGCQAPLPETENAWQKIIQIPVEPSISDRVFKKIIGRQLLPLSIGIKEPTGF